MAALKSWRVWAHGLFAALIGGGATSAYAWLGMTGAKAIGLDVPILNFKAVGVIFISGALTNVLAYLKQSPLPKEDEDTTETKP